MTRSHSGSSRSYPGRPERLAVQLTLDSILHGNMEGSVPSGANDFEEKRLCEEVKKRSREKLNEDKPTSE